MWNLRYGCYGQTVRLADEQKATPKKQRRRKFGAKKRAKRAGKKAWKAFRTKSDAYAVALVDRREYLIRSLNKGARIVAALIDQRRTDFDLKKKELLPLVGLCYLCEQQRARVRHHIIPIYRGGSNERSNLVPLCINCHDSIHPWLIESRSTAAGDKYPVSQHLAAVEQTTSSHPDAQ